jgi:hypothetical protein
MDLIIFISVIVVIFAGIFIYVLYSNFKDWRNYALKKSRIENDTLASGKVIRYKKRLYDADTYVRLRKEIIGSRSRKGDVEQKLKKRLSRYSFFARISWLRTSVLWSYDCRAVLELEDDFLNLKSNGEEAAVVSDWALKKIPEEIFEKKPGEARRVLLAGILAFTAPFLDVDIPFAFLIASFAVSDGLINYRQQKKKRARRIAFIGVILGIIGTILLLLREFVIHEPLGPWLTK